jgi:hypothetical protein
MSELYIYDDDLVEDYSLIEALTKSVTNRCKENTNIKTKDNEIQDQTESNKVESKN